MTARRLRLLPLGPQGLDPGLLPWLAAQLAERIALPAGVGEPLELRDAWYDPDRRQFSSNRVVDALVERTGTTAEPDEYLLAVTEADLFAEDREFVFGEATLGGYWAVISLARLRGHPEQLRQRALKEAVHELGHLAGLDHCPRVACAMHPARDADGIDCRGVDYCGTCRATLGAATARS